MSRFFFFLCICLSVSCFGQKRYLSVEETAVLKQFFNVLTEESELGYLLFNKKPVCIHGFYCKDPFSVGFPVHQQSVALREGTRIWKQLSKKNSDFIIHIYDKEDPLVPGYFHILSINKPLFLQMVNQHLPLFQYVLGPAVNSEQLLNALLNNHFHNALKNDKVLIGKVLGFGIQNSLYASRIENIQDAFEKENPPFLPTSALIRHYDEEYLPCNPSFGFQSINEEFKDTQDKLAVSSEKLVKNNPEFIFGWLKNSKKEQKFIVKLENTQDKIRKLLCSSDFLEKILYKVTSVKSVTTDTEKFRFPIAKNEINIILARGIWESLQEYDFDYLLDFIKGFNTTEQASPVIDRRAWSPHYLKEFREGMNNLETANHFFRYLESDQNFQSIIPQKLYYKTIAEGFSELKSDQSAVLLSYTIFSPNGHCLASKDKVCIDLQNTIPGFAHGVKGMKIGEMREIFIHPSLAYGFETSLEKCIYLKALVTLVDVSPQGDAIPPIVEIDLSFLTDSELFKQREENYKNALYEKGRRIAQHLKKCEEVDISIIAEILDQYFSKKEKLQTSQAEQDLINQVHWNIYQSLSS